MRTYLHLLESAKVFGGRVGHEDETIGLGFGIGTGKAAVVPGVSEEGSFDIVLILP
jgi:hypothetical protein